MNWEWCNTCLSPLHSGGRGSRIGKFKAIDWNSAVQGWFAYRRPCLQRRGGGGERGGRGREGGEGKRKRKRIGGGWRGGRISNYLIKSMPAVIFLDLKRMLKVCGYTMLVERKCVYEELDLKLPFSIYWRLAYSMSRRWVELLEDAGGTARHMSVAFRATDKALNIGLLFWRKVNKAGKLQTRLKPLKCTVTSSS